MTTRTAPDAGAAPGGWLPAYLSLALIWGSSFLLIKISVTELHPVHVTLGRLAAGLLTLLVILAATRDRLPRDPRLWAHLTVVGVIGVALPFTLFGYGEQRIPSLLAGIWNATTPLVVLPMAVLVFRTERMTARRAVGLGVGFLGVLVVLGAWRAAATGGALLTGQLMCFAAAACYGVGIPYLKRFVVDRAESGVSLAAGQLVAATAVLAVAAPLVAGAPPAPTALSASVVASVLALGVLGTGVAFWLNFRVLRLAGASTSASVTYLIPIVATAIGVLAVSEDLAWYQPVGGGLVLVGVAVAQGLHRRPLGWLAGRVSPPEAPGTGTGPVAARPGGGAVGTSPPAVGGAVPAQPAVGGAVPAQPAAGGAVPAA